MPKGVIQDWGLVEFFDPADTEATQIARNGYLLHGHSIRVHYCIPGVNAINIYMQVMKNNILELLQRLCILKYKIAPNISSTPSFVFRQWRMTYPLVPC